ncbi:hypothetical protein [Aliarcobacter butzleri]|uniref:hypothetical protein n=1 Tax=Aliarcobacter butzleri TaxID=28197 RepID=UPI0021B1E09A|nr:hypothetical protein [Aliarcobacter butzleri]MCT7581452.1 hypothetical protein [Aliarcobacter butzleri]
MKNKIGKFTIRLSEAVSTTGFSKSHIQYLIKANKIKSYLPSPKTRLIDYESLIDYIKNNKEVQ